ncbi:hypothetical protein [Pseudomonas aeruginosa]|uniref:Uncharacterized protein n=1 Tax=Pseudomonas aeruginosa TaxID=287 RepID=A0A643J6J8_PSEAI|nr:hypothetical protein [Pseudomonas aeruginosa]EKV4467487.1 hypothetical protein [Pseudomonas aeruginosa]ELQ7869618.1 hypothetical protein [Pseudomonas aeruginosa]KAB0768501.1 hypothetical protein F7O97_00295 [Pseudomonas aeruginosa]MBH8938567.1 hypothetical protein [Pseudomonas aeruginosa]MCW5394439.1 hypothetical protein [Pseudomonas aeruginosa]
MRVLGVHLLKGEFRFGVLEGTRQQPVLVVSRRVVTLSHDYAPSLMDWYDSQFRQLLASYAPERIAYRLTLDPKKEQLITSEFPYGILNLLAHQNNIPINYYTAQNYTASRLSLPKGTDLHSYCDSVLGQHPPYWDANQRNAILAAWFELQ